MTTARDIFKQVDTLNFQRDQVIQFGRILDEGVANYTVAFQRGTSVVPKVIIDRVSPAITKAVTDLVAELTAEAAALEARVTVTE